MKPKVAFLALMLGALLICACSGPSVKMGATTGAAFDWLVDPAPFRAQVRVDPNDPSTLHLENGLVRRTLHLSPNAASVDLLNLATGEAVLRAVRPEASIVLDGQAYDIGGL
ncbi:MAG: hypothetical protein ACXW3H_07500, partial [Candidatus Aminicenantales bacterium]